MPARLGPSLCRLDRITRPGLSGWLRRRRRHRLAGCAAFWILFAKSRPEVGGGGGASAFCYDLSTAAAASKVRQRRGC
jgi:hypothetical protein